MKILICNIAIRPQPDFFPPVACTVLCNVLIKAGYRPTFYNIDAQRPSPEELAEYFKKEQFNLVGISAVVSTGYRYTKKLAEIIKTVSPKTLIILGGNLAAAYEVILRKCQINLCVIGEGEKVLVNLVKHLGKYGNFKPEVKELSEIKGIAFLDSSGVCQVTGYETLIPNNEIEQPDYELLERFSNINLYVSDPMTRYDFSSDFRSHEARRKGKKMATILTSKGCINKCTFCHRWIKGYRVIPVEKVIAAMKHLIEKYNVGFFCIGDECFGESKQWLEEFIRQIKPLNILFQVGGMRISAVINDPALIRRLKEAGLTAVFFGMESGSNKILKVMEKNATCEENLAVCKICAEAGVYTTIQLVIGMPGENDRTINETIDFVQKASDGMPYPPVLSINYLQALPGTPCYEFLRNYGYLGKSIEDEEIYLLNVSDINATEFKHYVNVSEETLSKTKVWKTKIQVLNKIHWLKNNNWKIPSFGQEFYDEKKPDKGIINMFKYWLKQSLITYRIIDLTGERIWKLFLIRSRYSLYGLKKTLLLILGLVKEDDRARFQFKEESLRKFLVGI